MAELETSADHGPVAESAGGVERALCGNASVAAGHTLQIHRRPDQVAEAPERLDEIEGG